MTISDRKARERAERERLIVDQADQMLLEQGYHGLNLDELADRIEYSKATIYNHFGSKEDLMAAVDLRHLELRAELFGRALLFSGTTRERMFVVGWADYIIAMKYPHWSSLHQLMETRSIQEKITQSRLDACHRVGFRCIQVAFEIIRQARQCGELPDDGPSEAQILSGLISLSKGAHLLQENISMFPEDSGIRPLEMLNLNYHLFLDGAGWKPLRHQLDYDQTGLRIRKEVFSQELAALEKGSPLA